MRKCHLCEEVDVPLTSFFCERCFSIIRVGRMVHNLPIKHELLHDDDNLWYVIEVEQGDMLGGCHTPLEALEAAGIKDD